MAPIYLGLIVVLGVLVVTFLEELIHFVPHVFELRETDVILMTLSLLDVSLAASLVLMMIFAGYENFVAKIDTGDSDRPAWMGTLDFGGLKLKLISSIVAISGIDLLKSFMNIGQISALPHFRCTTDDSYDCSNYILMTIPSPDQMPLSCPHPCSVCCRSA